MNKPFYLIFGKTAPIPPQYQKKYLSESQRIKIASTRALGLIAPILMLLAAIFDYFLFPQYFAYIISIRGSIVLFCLILLAFTYNQRFQEYISAITMSGMIYTGIGVICINRVVFDVAPYYTGLNLIYLVMIIMPWGISKTLICCSVIYACHLISTLLYDWIRLDFMTFYNSNRFQIESIVVAAVANHFHTRWRKTEIVNRLMLSQQADELIASDISKREFISNITHELKTPLAVVVGNVDLITEQSPDETQRKTMDLIRRAALQLASHVDRVIAISNMDNPSIKPQLKRYDYPRVVQNVFSMFETRAREEQITYVINIAPRPCVVSIDVIQIEEVLNNLIQNAFKFTPIGGTISITISTDGERVYTEISDTGIGIPEEKISRIFDRGFQADDGLSLNHGGSGLGLHICKRNIEIHGGQISVHSIQHKSTSFKFSLPMCIDQSAETVNNPGTPERVHPESSLDASFKNSPSQSSKGERRHDFFDYQRRMGIDELAAMTYAHDVRNFENQKPQQPTVLILEDNLGMMKVLAETLHPDYNLLLGFNAAEALEKLHSADIPISLILSDIMMQGMTGFEFGTTVMSHEDNRHIPLIFITALMSPEDQKRGYNIGATDYVVKPFNTKILKYKVDHWIYRRQYELLLKNVSDSLKGRIKQLSKAKEIILHEINNPIQIITGASFFIEKLSDNFQQKSELNQLFQTLKKGTEALSSVLETSRHLEFDELSTYQPERLGKILNEARLQTRHFLKEIDFELDIGEAENLTIQCDRKMLIQVFVNLIRNSADAIRDYRHLRQGRIRITIELTSRRLVSIKIADNGIGMNAGVTEKLFRFKFTTKSDGSGIGLHLSKMIMDLHGGSISVQSQKGLGTTFTLSIPLSPSPAPMSNNSGSIEPGSRLADQQRFNP